MLVQLQRASLVHVDDIRKGDQHWIIVIVIFVVGFEKCWYLVYGS